ncbi:keratin-associated protein 27-1 [Pteronotus mesoamericanus]|uniref:keratin-associated protein 27-1 n=1 Tax=Pteronotus mesoamericanus TaxID=1884717 RepID=UPI0023ED47A9|nr:keratin-associated protein 27-1 [Pteronotus parnellii mesoamericanus]
MPLGHRAPRRGPPGAPPASAIVHGSHPVSSAAGLSLPSSCHGRTWLSGHVEETCSRGQGRRLEPQPCPGVAPTACAHACARERPTCPAGGSSAEFRRGTQPCPSGGSRPVGLAVQSRSPGTCVSKDRPTLECAPRRGRREPSSAAGEPTCCVTGGW